MRIRIRIDDTTTELIVAAPTPWARFGYAVNAILFPIQPLLGVGYSVAGNLITP